MDAGRGGKNRLRRRNVIVAVLDSGHCSTGLFTDQAARRHIPCVECKFPKTIKAARAHIGKVQRSGTESAHAARKLSKFHKVGKIVLWRIPGIIWKASHKQTLLKFSCSRDT